MAQAGYCDVCNQDVWLNEAGACPNGHDSLHVSNVREAAVAQPAPVAAPPAGKPFPVRTIGIVIAIIVLFFCICPVLSAFVIPFLT